LNPSSSSQNTRNLWISGVFHGENSFLAAFSRGGRLQAALAAIQDQSGGVDRVLSTVNNHTKGVVMAAGAAALWGTMSIFTRSLSQFHYTGIDIAYLRCLIAAVGMMLFLAKTNPSALKVGRKNVVIPLLYGAVTYTLGFVGYNVAVMRVPVAVVTVLTFMNPIFVCILSVIVFRERLHAKTLVSIAMCMVGAALATNLLGVDDFRVDFIGVFAALANGLGMAFQVVVPRYYGNRYQKDTLLAYGFLGATVVLALFADHKVILSSLTGAHAGLVWLDVLCFGVLCTLIANTCFSKSTTYVAPTTTSILSALEVVVGSIVGLLIFHEALNPLQVLGAVIIVAGSLGAELLPRRKAHA